MPTGLKTPGEILDQHLQQKGMNQSQLADELRVHHTTVNKIVKNKRHPSIEIFVEMSTILGPVFTLEYVEALNEVDGKLSARSNGALGESALPE